MRQLIGFVVGLYLTAALAVLGGGIYGFVTGQPAHSQNCATSWIPWALTRAAIWPKAYLDERAYTRDAADWLIVRYDPLSGVCR